MPSAPNVLFYFFHNMLSHARPPSKPFAASLGNPRYMSLLFLCIHLTSIERAIISVKFRVCLMEEIFDDSYLIEEKLSISAFARPEDLSFELCGAWSRAG